MLVGLAFVQRNGLRYDAQGDQAQPHLGREVA